MPPKGIRVTAPLQSLLHFIGLISDILKFKAGLSVIVNDLIVAQPPAETVTLIIPSHNPVTV